MDSGRTTILAGGLKLSSEDAINRSGILGTRRGWSNIRWYEYVFLLLGLLAAVATDGLTVARLVSVASLDDPDFAYGVLILVHSVFLLLFLLGGIFYQRIANIIAFFISAVILTVYVVAHYFARRKSTDQLHSTQATIRLIRLIVVVGFNICFIPLAILVIKDYRRDEFSKRLFGAFPTARQPLQIYGIFSCVARINTMLSISTLVLNLYNYTGYEIVDRILLFAGIPLVVCWLAFGIGMVRLESYVLICIFYFLSLFQFGFLGYCLYTGIQYSRTIARQSMSSTTPKPSGTTEAPAVNLVPILNVLYVCLSLNLLAHILSLGFGYWCVRNFNKGLKEKVFNNRLDVWIQERWSSK